MWLIPTKYYLKSGICWIALKGCKARFNDQIFLNSVLLEWCWEIRHHKEPHLQSILLNICFDEWLLCAHKHFLPVNFKKTQTHTTHIPPQSCYWKCTGVLLNNNNSVITLWTQYGWISIILTLLYYIKCTFPCFFRNLSKAVTYSKWYTSI